MWMKVDDGLHAHRKTRAVTKTHPAKRRDAAPMGIWVLAGSWAAQNGTDGWVPEDELDRWDEDWPALTDRLVRAGYWWPVERNGEPGYGFNDWLDYNPESEAASRSGTYGNHVRWHANRGAVDPECEHCPQEPPRPESPPESGGDIAPMRTRSEEQSETPPGLDHWSDGGPTGHSHAETEDPQVSGGDSGGDIGGRSGGESGSESRSIALPGPTRPHPTRPDPTPGAAIAVRGDDITAQSLVAEWIDHCESRPPGRVIGQVAKELKTLLNEGIEPDRVRRALAEWNRKGLHPSTLASVVHEIGNRAPAAKGQQATNDLFDRAMARAIAKESA